MCKSKGVVPPPPVIQKRVVCFAGMEPQALKQGMAGQVYVVCVQTQTQTNSRCRGRGRGDVLVAGAAAARCN